MAGHQQPRCCLLLRFSTETPTPSEEKPANPAADTLAQLQQQLKDQKDQLLRALADAENARSIARKDVDNARQFAVTKFAKSLLVSEHQNMTPWIPDEDLFWAGLRG